MKRIFYRSSSDEFFMAPVSRWLNVITGGDPSRTMSAEIGYQSIRGHRKLDRFILDLIWIILFGQVNHCHRSYLFRFGLKREVSALFADRSAPDWHWELVEVRKTLGRWLEIGMVSIVAIWLVLCLNFGWEWALFSLFFL